MKQSPKCTPAQIRVLDNLAMKKPMDLGFNRLNGFSKTVESLRHKGLISENVITPLGLAIIKAG
jgi:hypothetical protein